MHTASVVHKTVVFPTRYLWQSAALMRAMDQVDVCYGRGTLRLLATGVERSWGKRDGLLTQGYIMQAGEFMQARAV